MQRALDTLGREVVAWEAARERRYVCPACGENVLLKAGPVVVEHFAHRAGAACPLGEGESRRHLQMKKQMALLLGRMGCAVRCEVPVAGERRADLLAAERFAVECQESPIGVEEVQARSEDYTRAECAVLWVWDLARLGVERFADIAAEREVRVPAEIRHWHRESFGRVYLLDVEGELRACHLEAAERRMSDGGPEGKWRDHAPRTFRRLGTHACGSRLCAFTGAGGSLRLAGLGEPVWWMPLESRSAQPGYVALLRLGPFYRIEAAAEASPRAVTGWRGGPAAMEPVHFIPAHDRAAARDRLRRRFTHRYDSGMDAYNLTPDDIALILSLIAA